MTTVCESVVFRSPLRSPALAAALALALSLAACGDDDGGGMDDTPGGGTGGQTPGGGNGGPMDPPAATFTQVNTMVFQTSCSTFSSCHDSSGPPASGLDLQTDPYNAIVNAMAVGAAGRTLVVPSNPDSSYLYEKINNDMPQVGDRMPPNFDKLPADRLELVRSWIAGGALNN